MGGIDIYGGHRRRPDPRQKIGCQGSTNNSTKGQKGLSHLSTTMVAMLTALDLCDALGKSGTECERLRPLKKAVEDSACTRFDGEEAEESSV